MSYLIFPSMVILVLGAVGVASNPSPYYAALGLVMAAAGGCGILIGCGGFFISLVLFLVYLGGMLVVFGYTAALVSDDYPEEFMEWSVAYRLVGCLLITVLLDSLGGRSVYVCVQVGEHSRHSAVSSELGGMSCLYGDGGLLLIICGWVLLLTLLVILELTRGGGWGTLRSI
uniref:NADH-ubiquinone oxidoreductase chain 6 n=1 Tax=Ariosoma shiroanago TaxID=135220 RepID=D1YU34_ARISH|nr:NADH dehydrogenase subunit 6 [Ariosoma shiroanago]BAI53418.1 NADH dehydrogenase subunit 6 [Ariosoma shiroanago]